jgi:transcriptional regulator with XRE-family HTH domain
MATTFGQFIKERRGKLELGLREFCIVASIDPSNYSKYERDILPPSPDHLKRIAKALKIKTNTENWDLMQSLLAAAKEEIPSDWTKNKRVMELLPAFYQKLRGYDTPGDEDPIAELVRLLRREVSK